jgi:hypothetical protein
VKLRTGNLARHVTNHSVGVVISVDPPTACCGYEPCNHSIDKYYTPMAKILWQTGRAAGKEGVVWANMLETIDRAPRDS